MKNVLVVSKGFFHPTVFCRRELAKTIMELDGTNARFTSKLESIDGINPNGTDAVVLFFHEKDIKEPNLKALTTYVDNGGLLLCIHGALASFKTYSEYNKLTGSLFTGHGNIKSMTVTGISEFTIKDEPYEFKLSEGCHILCESDGLPICWVNKFGKGSVIGLSPGHKLNTIMNLGFKNMVKYILNEY